jgi:hypothetical protein
MENHHPPKVTYSIPGAFLECPICYEVPQNGPIFQCENGHFICCECRKQVQTCPSCRGTMIKSRNLFAEKALENLSKSCKFGCNQLPKMDTRKNMEKHEKNCDWRNTKCPCCQTLISLKCLDEHFENSHGFEIETENWSAKNSSQFFKINFPDIQNNIFKMFKVIISDVVGIYIIPQNMAKIGQNQNFGMFVMTLTEFKFDFNIEVKCGDDFYDCTNWIKSELSDPGTNNRKSPEKPRFNLLIDQENQRKKIDLTIILISQAIFMDNTLETLLKVAKRLEKGTTKLENRWYFGTKIEPFLGSLKKKLSPQGSPRGTPNSL